MLQINNVGSRAHLQRPESTRKASQSCWTVLVYTLLISVLTGIVFGLILALSASHENVNATLKESGARSGAGFGQNKVRSILVVMEMALALVLLVGAGPLIRTFMVLRTVDPGYDAPEERRDSILGVFPRFWACFSTVRVVFGLGASGG